MVRKVQSNISPYFYAFYNQHSVHVVVDTGATSSLISKSFLRRIGISEKPTYHTARAADKSPIVISGEVKLSLSFGSLSLPITALVIDSLDCDILAGVPFCKENNISVHLQKESISIQNIFVKYGGKPENHDIYRTECFVIHNDKPKSLFPGDYVEYASESLIGFDGEISIEPHDETKSWPLRTISRVIQGKIRIGNPSENAICLAKSEHIAKIRRVTCPEISDKSSFPVQNVIDTDNTHAISIDPDKVHGGKFVAAFKTLNSKYSSVFSSKFEKYNDNSGKIRARVEVGKVLPPPRKGKLPFYNKDNLQLLQEEADKLEALGVLARPEDLGISVKYVSPSFLRRKPCGGQRFVTAFNELGQYVRLPPSVTTSPNDVLRRISSWKYLVQSDLTKSFYQIPVTKESLPFLGTVTPFKGVRVYTRSAMGMPGSSESLQELVSRVLGDYVQEGWLVTIHDDIYVGSEDSHDELLARWEKVLLRFKENNLTLSAVKTIIGALKTTILGWIWKSGTISASSHKTAPLSVLDPPKTCTAMKSFIGAFRAISRCFPNYASLLSPLEDSIKGLKGAQRIQWSEELLEAFRKVQMLVKSPNVLTVPKRNDQLIISMDASPLNSGIGATLFVLRDGKRSVSEFFSAKLKTHHRNWLPCELEALAISTAIDHFKPFIIDSVHTTKVLTDSKACKQAYDKLCHGNFSASARISTFLSTLSSYNVRVEHVKGINNPSSDFSSRNPLECTEENCQVCSFLNDVCNATIRSVNEVLSGTMQVPFSNPIAWRSAQHESSILRRVYAHLSQGTRPPKKARNLTEVRRYLQIATIDNNGVLVVKKSDLQGNERSLIIIPSDILYGVLTALHLQLGHPTKTQLGKVFDRAFYAPKSEATISQITDSCASCAALKRVPKSFREQHGTAIPDHPGSYFYSDIVRRNRQKIMLTRDVFSGYLCGIILPNETSKELKRGLTTTTQLLRSKNCVVRVDNAPGFQGLKDDNDLKQRGILIDLGRVKNPNKTCVVDKAIQEFESELRRKGSSETLTETELSSILECLNGIIRNRGFSAKEIILSRNQYTGENLSLKDSILAEKQKQIRDGNHLPSALSKAHSNKLEVIDSISVGDLVFIKHEGNKFQARKMYIVVKRNKDRLSLQQITQGKFSSKKYDVPICDVYPLNPGPDPKGNFHQKDDSSESECDAFDTLEGIQDDLLPGKNADKESVGPMEKEGRTMEVDPEQGGQRPEELDTEEVTEEEEQENEVREEGRILRPRANLLPPARYRDS